MFCLMDVSGSMSEHMKDLAKRFYMLLYVFLKRRYKPRRDRVHPSYRPRRGGGRRDILPRSGAGGTLVSSALQAMDEIVRCALSPGGLEHLRRPGLRRRQLLFRRRGPAPLLTDMILPVSQYLCLSRGRRGRRATVRYRRTLALALYRALARRRRAAVDAQSQRPHEIFPVFHDSFQRRGGNRSWPRHDRQPRTPV